MKAPACYHCEQATLTRRDFLRVRSLSFLGISLSDFLRFGRVAFRAIACARGIRSWAP
jgi:hypothetical protein